jgi:hypothetical protein
VFTLSLTVRRRPFTPFGGRPLAYVTSCFLLPPPPTRTRASTRPHALTPSPSPKLQSWPMSRSLHPGPPARPPILSLPTLSCSARGEGGPKHILIFHCESSAKRAVPRFYWYWYSYYSSSAVPCPCKLASEPSTPAPRSPTALHNALFSARKAPAFEGSCR